MKMDLSAVMDALARSTEAAGIERGYGWPTTQFSPPCVCVGYPTDFQAGITGTRGNDRAVFPVWLILGAINSRSTRDVAATYFTGAANDLVDALNAADTDPAMQSCRVAAMQVEPYVELGGGTYLSIRFDVDVLT